MQPFLRLILYSLFAVRCLTFYYPIQDYVTLLSLFLLTCFNLVTLEFSSSVPRAVWCTERQTLTFLLPNPGLEAAYFALVLDNRGGHFTPGGFGIHNDILAKRREALPAPWLLGDTNNKYSGRALHPGYSYVYHVKVGAWILGPVSRDGGGGITELGLFTMPMHN